MRERKRRINIIDSKTRLCIVWWKHLLNLNLSKRRVWQHTLHCPSMWWVHTISGLQDLALLKNTSKKLGAPPSVETELWPHWCIKAVDCGAPLSQAEMVLCLSIRKYIIYAHNDIYVIFISCIEASFDVTLRTRKVEQMAVYFILSN